MFIRCKNCGYVTNIKTTRGTRIKELNCPSCNKTNTTFKRMNTESDEFDAYLFYKKPEKLTDKMIKEFVKNYKEQYLLEQEKEELKILKEDLLNILKDEKILNEFKKENLNIENEIKKDIEWIDVLLAKNNFNKLSNVIKKLEEKYKKYDSWYYILFL